MADLHDSIDTSADVREVAPEADTGRLGRAARAGTAWAITQSLVSKMGSLLGQIALAWLLKPAQMGVAGTALSVHGMFLFFNPSIMNDVLIQRKATFDRDARPGLWISLLLGAVTGLLILASGPIWASTHNDSVFIGLLAVLALRPIGMALQAVSVAKLRMHFRFGAYANWSVWTALGGTALSVALAAAGLGPYSLVIPAVAVLFVCAYIFERLAPTPSAWRPTLVGAKPLLAEWTTLCGGQYAHTVSLFIDYLVLSFFAPDAEVGFYFFAFNLSGQLNGVIIYNVSMVLQPIFSELRDDPARQMRAFLKVTTAISAVSMPLCFLQAILAEPLLRMIFNEKWLPAAPILAILCMAQAIAFAVGPATAMLKGQSRFRVYVLWQSVQTGLLIPALILAAWLGPKILDTPNPSAKLAAIVIVLEFVISAPTGLWLAIRPGGGRLGDVARPFVRPFVAALPSFAPVWLLCSWLPESMWSHVSQIVLVPPLLLVTYAAGLRIVDRETYELLRENFGSMLGKLTRRLRRA